MGRVLRFMRRRNGPWSKPSKSPWEKPPPPSRKWFLAAGGLLAFSIGGLIAHLATGGDVPAFVKASPVGAALSAVRGPFTYCAVSFGRDCVVDGDTIEINGQRIRMVDYDTPEISAPNCASEYALGQRAKLRLLELLNSSKVEVQVSGVRDFDKYGRKLRLVLVNGRSVGDTLIAEGLAWRWEGHRHAWCQD